MMSVHALVSACAFIVAFITPAVEIVIVAWCYGLSAKIAGMTIALVSTDDFSAALVFITVAVTIVIVAIR